MRIIQITDNLRVKNADNLNWNVEEMKISPEMIKGKPNQNAGQQRWVTSGHYPTLDYALTGAKGVLEKLYKEDGDVVKLEDAIEVILQSREVILKALSRSLDINPGHVKSQPKED
jgi:hypothetical protein